METEKLHLAGLPKGLPRKLVSKLVWEGQDVAKKHDIVYTLSELQVAEIESALGHFKGTVHPRALLSSNLS